MVSHYLERNDLTIVGVWGLAQAINRGLGNFFFQYFGSMNILYAVPDGVLRQLNAN